MPVRLLFLDRDGTLNRTLGQRPPNTPEEVELLPGLEAVLPRYVAEGWQVVVVTNQGGVASGYFTEAQAHAVQQRVIDRLPIPTVASYLCPHASEGIVAEYAIDCPNRKPKPGFILNALQVFGARAQDCLFVGDAITDMQAAQAAGVPFCWADRFFGRPIDRGLLTREGDWMQVCEPTRADQEEEVKRASAHKDLHLLATVRGQLVGRLALLRGRPSDSGHAAELTLQVEAGWRCKGIGSLLIETALEWGQQQSEVQRFCAQVVDSNLPALRLLRKAGFVEQGGETQDRTGSQSDLITMTRHL